MNSVYKDLLRISNPALKIGGMFSSNLKKSQEELSKQYCQMAKVLKHWAEVVVFPLLKPISDQTFTRLCKFEFRMLQIKITAISSGYSKLNLSLLLVKPAT